MEEHSSGGLNNELKPEFEAPSDSVVESPPNLDQELDEEVGPLDVHLVPSLMLDSSDYVNIYKINRNHIREQSKAVIPACGVLLTGAFGLLYFIFNGNGDKIKVNPIIIILIVVAAILLAASFYYSIKSVQATSPMGELPETRDQQWDFISDIYDEEYKCGKYSIGLLGGALFLLIIIILYFSVSYLLGASSANAAQVEQHYNFIVIPIPRLF